VTISTGKSLDRAWETLRAVQEILTKLPPKCEWYAVCWDYDECCFDTSTIRQEPERGEDPRFFKQPLVWPWVYIPRDADLPDNFQSPGYTRVVAAVKQLNESCHWQRNTDEIADIVASVGGCLLRGIASGMTPNTTPPPRFRPSTTVRIRSQPQRYTRAKARGEQLANLASNNRSRARTALRDSIRQSRTIHRPIPQVSEHGGTFVPGHQLRGETEEAFRERVGLETWADEIIRCVEAQWSKGK
jgi:hypothetical protein